MSDPAGSLLSLRADLIRQRIQMGDRFVWVLKDPLSRAFFYFSDREFSILKLLDGRRHVSDIIAACRERLAPDFVSAEAVITFLADARQNGLITASSSDANLGGVDGSQTTARPSRWKNLLAIRLPGLNPDRWLDWATPKLRPLFLPAVHVVAICLGMIAVIMVAANFDQFVWHLSAAATRSSGSWLIMVVVVISLTKIVHELAHAVACKAFGAECREIGVMFLVGIPCLYCDVSDAWMLSQRFKRIIVSAAGMFAELLLATAATFLWVLSTDGVVRDLCVTTMIVCSISTVLFNGNPLLRYDGYFILSDLLRIPNLASESSTLLRGAYRRWLWRLPAIAGRSTAAEPKRVRTLAVYGVLSGVYRFVVLALIGLVIYRFADGIGIGFAGGLIAIAMLLSSVWRSVYSIVRPPTALESRSASGSRGPMLIMTVFGLLAIVAFSIPWPRSVIAPAAIEPAGMVDLFVETPGRLVWAAGPGAQVAAGDRIATFQSDEVQSEILAVKTRQATLRAELASLQQRRSLDDQAADKIPSVTEALQAADNDLKERVARADRLMIRAPRSGRVFASRNRYQPPTEDNEVTTWDGTPLDEQNIGAHFEEGTLLCSIGDDSAREAMVLVRQQDIALVRNGQTVQLITPTHSSGHDVGTIIEVATSPIIQVPREFFAAALVDPSTNSSVPGATRNTYYQVRVRLKDGAAPLIIRSTAGAKIKIQPASLASRLLRFLSDSFRFQL